MKKILGLFAVATLGSGCIGGGMAAQPGNRGFVSVTADEKGMRAFGDVMNGMITNGKASPDKDTPHWEMRRKQGEEETIRDTSPGTLERIFGATGTTPTVGVK